MTTIGSAMALLAALAWPPGSFLPDGPIQTGAPIPASPATDRMRVRVPLAYDVAGKGEPVVLIHGGQLDRRMWDDQFTRYASRFQVVRYDVRGYGKSPAPLEPYSDVDDLRDLLDDLKIETANLVGLSLGGRIAIDFAIQYPKRVRSIVLAGPGVSGLRHESDDVDDAAMWEIIQAIRDGEVERGIEAWLATGYMKPAMENPALAARLRQISMEDAHCWLANPILARPLKPRANERLGEIHCPTLIVVGDRDVPSIHENVKRLMESVANAKKVVIAGAGHMVNMEKPAEFDAAVLPFLEAQASAK
ncbi:MAG: alpha/beta hydrolase [Planctomycetes bacterium]|nr:alpha/beta hydrolase [Planctomycetota bacterium]